MAELLLTAGTDDEIFTILGLIVTPLFAYLVYIGFFVMDAMDVVNVKRNGGKIMAKNLIPKIATMLGVRINESFKLAGYDNATFKFTENRFWQENGNLCEERSDILAMLLAGNEIIIKQPWKPSEGQTVYSFYSVGLDGVLKVVDFIWVNDIITFQALVKAGWVYKTRAEAEAALPAVAAEMGVEYEL